MTATIAPSAAPPYAVLAWCDLRSIYIQLPSINGPCVISFPLSEAGLSKALTLMRGKHHNEGAGVPYAAPLPAPLAKPTTPQREAVRDILRRRGILP